MRNKITTCFVNIFFCFLLLILGCDSEKYERPITYTEKETLTFLVSNADVIAIVDIEGGTDKEKVSFFSMPKTVKATIVSKIKGSFDSTNIQIVSGPKYTSPNAVKSSVVLRNGRHLVFLSRDNKFYKPTTMFSLLGVSNNRVYPIWRKDFDGTEVINGREYKITNGYALKAILNGIEKEISKQQSKTGTDLLCGRARSCSQAGENPAPEGRSATG